MFARWVLFEGIQRVYLATMKQVCGRATNSVHVCTADQAQSLECRALQRFLGFKEESTTDLKIKNGSNTEATKRFFWTPRKKRFLGCLWRSFPVALKPSTLQLCNAQQLYWWTPLETLKQLSCRFEAFNLATLQRATALLMDTTRNAETPPTPQWPEKLPNVAETLDTTRNNSSTDGHHSKRWNTT